MPRSPKRLPRLASIALAAGLAVTMAACSSTGTEPSASGSKPNITIWSRPGSLGKDSQAAAQKAFPNYHLKFVANAQIDDALHSALRANSGLPDVAFLGGELPDYFSVSNKFLDLDKYGFSSHKKDYYPFAIKSAQSPNGRQIAAPTDVAPYVFFYDAKVFQSLGLPTDPAEVGKAISNWSDFKAVAEKAKAGGKLLCDSEQGIYELYMVQHGFMYFNLKNGKATLDAGTQISKAAFDNAASWAQAGLCGTAAPYSTDWNAGVTQGAISGFVEPAYVGGILKPAAAATSGDWRIAEGTPGGPATMAGSFVTAFASTKEPSAAAQLVLYFSSAKAQSSAYASNGLIPSTTASYKDAKVLAPDPFYGGQVAIDPIHAAAKAGPFTFRGPNGNAIMTSFEQSLVNVQSGADPAGEYSKTVSAAKAAG